MGGSKPHLEFTVNLLSRIQAKAAHCCDLFEQKPRLKMPPPPKGSKLASDGARPNTAASTFNPAFRCYFSGHTGG